MNTGDVMLDVDGGDATIVVPLADITAGHDDLTPAREAELVRAHYFGYQTMSDLLGDEGLFDSFSVYVQAKLSDGSVESFAVRAADLPGRG